MRKRTISLILFGVGLFLFYLMISRIGLLKILEIFKHINLFFPAVGILLYLAAMAIRARKWFVLSRLFKDNLRYRDILPFYASNALIGNLTPFKAGETATPFLLKKYFKIPVGQGFLIIIIDRFSELLFFMLLLVWAVFYFNSRALINDLLSKFILALFVFFSALLVLLISVIFFQRLYLKLISGIAKVKFLKKYCAFMERELCYLYEGVRLVRNNKIYGKILLLTVFGWVIEMSSFYTIFLSIFRPYFFDVAAVQVLSAGAGLVTFIPDGVGISEISSSTLLKLMGYPLSQAVAAMILGRIVLSGCLFLFGFISFSLMKERWGKDFN